MLFERFYPDEVIDSAYDIPYSNLYEEGYRGIIFDIDNTLVHHGAPANQQAIVLFQELRKLGFKTILISNNNEPRVKSFADLVESPYIYKAAKPHPKSYLRAMKMMGTSKNETIFIGDQVFTDIMGAKKVGLRNILTRPIHPKEEIQIVLKRYLERIVLHSFHRKNSQ